MDDYRVAAKSNAQVRQEAKRALNFFGAANKSPVDVLACLCQPRIYTVKGERRLHFYVVPDNELGLDDGRTTFRSDGIRIEAKQSVYDKARFGDGGSRNTLAHELGRAVLYHDRAPMAQRALGNVTPKSIDSFESAEHQVKVFAAAFLIDDQLARHLSSARAISEQCCVSLESAAIYFEQLEEERNRAVHVQAIELKADEFPARHSEPRFGVHFIDEACPNCGARTIFPVGSKYMCKTCNLVSDGFQDGDKID